MIAKLPPMRVWTTTDNQAQAAAVAQRLIDEEGLDATYWEAADLDAAGFWLKSSFKYAVVIIGPTPGDPDQ